MEYKIVPFQQLNDEQIAEIAKLHRAVLHSLLAELGLSFLERYYQIARNDVEVIGFCTLSDAGNPLGWVVGTSKPDQLNGRLKEPFLWFVSQLLCVLLVNPSLIWQLVVSSRASSFKLKDGYIELVYIGVSPSARGQGLGRALMDAFVQASKGKYHCVTLSVEEENAEAIRLYTKAGYQVTQTVIEGKFKRHRMELNI